VRHLHSSGAARLDPRLARFSTFPRRLLPASFKTERPLFHRSARFAPRRSVFVGTDPNVWWEGFEALREAMRAQAEAMGSGGLQIVSGQLQAYREGSVGWAVDRDASFRLPDGTEIPFRNTVVFLQEDSEWKLIHGHSPIGVSNEEMFGKDVTA
jgi:ketosteroid isomerase-like protein